MNPLTRFLGLSLLVALPQLVAAQEPVATGSTFTAAQLEQMAAPIALYPDSLLTQIMMASTYPLEVVEASRWVQKNPGLAGSELEEALKAHDWDPSVKSLCGLPDVLKRMNENLDWTQDLGDAFLAQRAELLDTVQRMRGKAYEAGNLKTTEQQTVTRQEDKIIVIQSSSPQVIYVPTYSPTVVYGPTWYYPTYYYPPMYAPPPPGYGAMMFTVGVAVGAAAYGGCGWGWGHSDVDIDVNHYNSFTRNTNVNAEKYNLQNKSGDKAAWNHDPQHRKGVNYGNSKTAQQYGAKSGSSRVTQQQARGHGGSSDRATAASTRPAASQQQGAAPRKQGASPHSSQTSRGQVQQRSSAGASSRSSGGRSSAWGGSRSPSMDRSASARGASSRSGGRSSGGGGGRRR